MPQTLGYKRVKFHNVSRENIAAEGGGNCREI